MLGQAVSSHRCKRHPLRFVTAHPALTPGLPLNHVSIRVVYIWCRARTVFRSTATSPRPPALIACALSTHLHRGITGAVCADFSVVRKFPEGRG